MLIVILKFGLFVYYNVSMLLHYQEIFLPKKGYWTSFALVIVANILFSTLLDEIQIPSHYGVLLMMILFSLEIKRMYKTDVMQALFVGGFFIAVLYWGRGIVLMAFSLVLHEGVQWVREHEYYYQITLVISLCFSIIFIELLWRTIASEAKMKRIFRNKGQLRFVVIYQFITLCYSLFLNYGRFFELSQPWYKLIYLITCVLCFVVMCFIFNNSVKISYLLEYEMHKQLLQEQLDRQLRHYKSYQKYTESFRAFKHDYKDMMTSVKALLVAREHEKTVKMIDDIHDTMQKNVLVHKTYSSHMLLDAILQDTANVCEANAIRFSAMAHIPKEINISDIDMIRIFSNLANNAVEACQKIVPETDRFLAVTSSVNRETGWVMIEVANSFSGVLNMRDGRLESTKTDKGYHGIGLKVVTEIMESFGGLLKIDANQEEKIFTASLLFPHNI